MLFIKNGKTLRSDVRIKGNGWLFVPPEIEADVLKYLPFAKYTLDGDTIIGVTDDVEARELSSLKTPVVDVTADIMTMVVDQEYRLTLLELGVTK